MALLEWGLLSAFFMACFSSIFTIMNPFSTVSVFMGMTDDKTKEEKLEIAKRSTIVAAIIMIVFSFMGNFILSFFSITLDAFRIAGGLLVANVGLNMLKGNGKARLPVARFDFHPKNPVLDEPVTFKSESTDPDGFITREEWFLNDVKVGQGHIFTYLFDKIGTYNILLKVTDNRGATENIVKQVTIEEELEQKKPIAQFRYEPLVPDINSKIKFTSESYDPSGFITNEEWFINGELVKKFKGPNSTLEKKLKTPGIYNIVLRVTDNNGVRTKLFKQIVVSSDKIMKTNKDNIDDMAIIPLAIPMLSGPGSITAALMLMSEATNIAMTAVVVFTIILVCAIAYWLLINADMVNRIMGKTTRKIVDKLLGLIVLVVGVQFLINGITNLIKVWAGLL
ncbi:MAG: MarC family protein [Candidatus Woesearchaeota archaeon]